MEKQQARNPIILAKEIRLRDVIIVLLIFIAVCTRLVGLGDRVMSHDEVNHVVPAFDLFAGRGYRHDPVTHGPLQFHLMALMYFVFGDNDFTSRLPHALSSIALIIIVVTVFRKYLGNIGAIIAGALFTISPFMLFYGRYARNDVICALLGIVAIFAILEYFDTGKVKYLFYLSASLALNFTAKETAYIFSAQVLIFLLIFFIRDITRIRLCESQSKRNFFSANILLIAIIIASLGASILIYRFTYPNVPLDQISVLIQNNNSTFSWQNFIGLSAEILKYVLPGVVPMVAGLVAVFFIRPHLRWDILKNAKSFNLLVLIGTLVLPLLAPFPVSFAGIDPSAYTDPFAMVTNYVYIGFFFAVSVLVGSNWDYENWWKLAALFFAIYTVLYTTFFTNTVGLITGMLGSLGHWLKQQSVQRGGQPPYYFALILLPMYEFLSLVGFFIAVWIGVKNKTFLSNRSTRINKAIQNESPVESSPDQPTVWLAEKTATPHPSLFIFLFITGLIAYTLAGEKMPWLTVHIVYPLLLTASWSFGKVAEKYLRIIKSKQWDIFLVSFCALFTAFLIILKFLGNNPPFTGKTQQQLQQSYSALFLIGFLGILILYLIKNRGSYQTKTLSLSMLSSFLLILFIITIRTSYRAAYINYDNAREFLVYAHASEGPKRVLSQVEEISQRLTGGLDVKVAYDNHGLYPYWWYFRHYPNKIAYMENPTRSLEEAPLIIAGQDKYGKLEPIVKNNYYAYEYIRLWWPMQDYWNLNWGRIQNALFNPQMRQALFNIWLNRDYSLYAEVNNNENLSLENWLPSDKMRFYIRKDIAAQMWNLNTDAAIVHPVETDPYHEKTISKQPDGFISASGAEPGFLNAPRGLEIASDGSIFLADSLNHRIQHFSPDGILLESFGTFANVLDGNAPGGTFNEPWDIALGSDGSLFVTDTFNHRIQKFDADGNFVKMWGTFAQGNTPETFWGPRGIATDKDGYVFVTDTGNKRVVIFDEDLNYVNQIGKGGFEMGEFDEPVGISISDSGEIVVADTWNRRVQIIHYNQNVSIFTPLNSFDVSAWYGQSIDNKPFLTTDEEGDIYISDPEGSRILKFNSSGEFLAGFQDMDISDDKIAFPFGLGIDDQGKIWYSDASANVIAFINQE